MAKDEPKAKIPSDHYIIDTNTPSNKFLGIDYEHRDASKNPEVVKLAEKAKSGELRKENPGLPNGERLCANVNNWIMTEHMTPETLVAATDENGWIWIHKSQGLELAQTILKNLRRMDKGVSVHNMGIYFEEKEEEKVTSTQNKLRDRITGKDKIRALKEARARR